ncbi:hypothetical protein Pelo_19258 [Pelomyxa schiedti]|nr:hypothetical protein Pelo_19258 [Pelomyxa schiedti]
MGGGPDVHVFLGLSATLGVSRRGWGCWRAADPRGRLLPVAVADDPRSAAPLCEDVCGCIGPDRFVVRTTCASRTLVRVVEGTSGGAVRATLLVRGGSGRWVRGVCCNLRWVVLQVGYTLHVWRVVDGAAVAIPPQRDDGGLEEVEGGVGGHCVIYDGRLGEFSGSCLSFSSEDSNLLLCCPEIPTYNGRNSLWYIDMEATVQQRNSLVVKKEVSVPVPPSARVVSLTTSEPVRSTTTARWEEFILLEPGT